MNIDQFLIENDISKEERFAYALGFTSVKFFDLKGIFCGDNSNPYEKLWATPQEYRLWEAYEIGYNDGFNDEVEMINSRESLTDE